MAAILPYEEIVASARARAMIERISISYSALKKNAWTQSGGIRLKRKAGFSVEITLCGNADKRLADRALIYVQRDKRRQFRLTR
jgi:hypothetical protein